MGIFHVGVFLILSGFPYVSDSYFNEEIGYSEENTSDNEDFRSTVLQPLRFEPEENNFW